MLRFLRPLIFLVLFACFGFSSSQETLAAAPANVEAGFQSILAQGIIFGNICESPAVPGQVDTCECRSLGHCNLSNILQFAVNITIFILGISGSVALLMFFYGGLLWITAQGKTERIDAGKDTLRHAVIGLAIIFSAYAFVNYVLAALIGRLPGTTIEQTIQSTAGVDASAVIQSNTEQNN